MAQLKTPGARYRIDRPLGSGSGGKVVLAMDTVLGRQAALKSLHGGDYETLVREARVLAALHHPNIVQVYDVARIRGELFLVLEYAPGRSLREVLAGGPLPPEQAVGYTVDVARALAYAHREGILHNDVKPDNIIIDTSGEARLTDFGAGRFGAQTLLPGEADTIAGSLPYIAPELIQGADPGPQSDLYSLAATLYEMVIGEPPFAGTGGASLAQRLAGPPPGLRQAPGLARGLAGVLERALSPSPVQRYADADAFADALTALGRNPFRTAGAVAEPALMFAAHGEPPRRRRPFVTAGLAAAGALALAGVGFALSRGGEGPTAATETPTTAVASLATTTPTAAAPTVQAQPPRAQDAVPAPATPAPKKGRGNGKKD